MDKQTAKISDWFVAKTPDGHELLIGHVTDHPRQADFKAKYQSTSVLVKLDMVAKIAETSNTIYTLGDQRYEQ